MSQYDDLMTDQCRQSSYLLGLSHSGETVITQINVASMYFCQCRWSGKNAGSQALKGVKYGLFLFGCFRQNTEGNRYVEPGLIAKVAK